MFQKLGQKRVILPLAILFLVNLALFSLPGVPGSRPVILATAEDGVNIPDIMGLYSPGDVYYFLETIGPDGRSAYQTMHFATDLAFPLVYGALLFALLCRKAQKSPGKLGRLPFIALIPVVSDLAENFSMVTITAQFPDFLPGLTRMAQVFTILKFAGIGFCILALFIFTTNKYLSTKSTAQET